MASVDFKASASRIVELVGGTANISKVAHCVTRVRFTLKDQSIASANTEAIKTVPGVMQVVVAGGQYQVVIGSQVENMYDEVVALTGMGDGEVPAGNAAPKSKLNPMDLIMKLVSGIMMPIMPALVGCGIITALFNVLNVLGVVSAENGFGFILYAIGQTCLYFFPVLVGGSAAKYFGLDMYVGNVVGAAMIYPTFIEAFTSSASITIFGTIPLVLLNYTSTVFPAIVAVWFASLVNKFFKKIIPSVLRFTLVSPLTLLVTVPVALLVIGPVTGGISMALSSVTLAVYNLSPIICGFVLGGAWVLFVVPLGLHWGFLAVFMNNLFTLGYEPIMGLLAGILSFSGTLLAIAAKSKKPETRSNAIGCAISNALGISEPGLYGFILQHKATIVTSFLGSATSGVVAAIFHSAIYMMGGFAGLFALPGYINPNGDMSSLIGAILSNVVGFIVCFVLTWFAKFDPDKADV